jgi:hypothetical protein
MNLVSAQLAVLVHAVEVRTQGLRDLANLRDDFLAVSEDDEDILVGFLVGLWIDDGLRDLGLVHVQVAAQCPPKDSLECCNSFSGNDSGNKSNIHDGEGPIASFTILSALLDVAKEGGIIVINRVSDFFGLAASLSQL